MSKNKKTIYLAIDGNEANVEKRVGSNVYAFEILQQFYKQCKKSSQWQITVLLAREKVADLPETRKNWTYVYLQPQKLWTQWALPIHLFLHRKDYDLFFTPGHYAPRFSSVPYISSVMDLAYLHFPQQFRPEDLLQLKSWTKYSVKNAKKVLTISDFSKQEIIKHYGRSAKDILVAPPANRFAKSAKQEESKQFFRQHDIKNNCFLYLGTLQPRKNLSSLIRAYEIFLLETLAQTNNNKDRALAQAPQLVIAGKVGWLSDDLLKQIDKFIFKEKIIVTGFVPSKFKKALYQRAKLSFLLSLYEGFGIPALESIEAGCLPIVADNSSLNEVVAETKLSVDPQDHQAIAQKMLDFNKLSSKKYQSLISARQKYAKRFTWEKSAKKILALIKKTAKESRNA